jgi:hypothetical protein
MTHIALDMNWQKVNEFVEAWAAERALLADLRGHTLTLVDFESEEDCGFFYPGRTLLAQKAFTSALAKFARARHARTEHVTINPDHYRHWLLAERAEDSEENRGRYIESRYQVIAFGGTNASAGGKKRVMSRRGRKP